LKIKPFHKIEAGALQLVIFVTVVIALLLSSFILYLHLNTLYKLDNDHTINSIKISDSGFEWIKTHKIDYKDTIRNEISKTESLKLIKSHWGIYDLVNVTGKTQNKEFNKVALVGGISPLNKNFALSLNNQRNPLVLVGDTFLKGELYTSPYGIKAGNISELYYENRDLYQGNLNTDDVDLRIDNEKKDYLKSISFAYNSQEKTFIDKLPDTLSQSFKNQALVYYSEEDIYLEGLSVYGQVVIQSKKSITVDQTSILEDVILIAPSINIKQGFRGTIQCFSSELISVEKNVQLNYPSTLLINPDNSINTEKKPKLIINSNTQINGSLIYFRNNAQENQYDSNIYIGANSKIFGMIYSEENLELYGSVMGSVITERFITRYKSSTYINHLLNVTISSAMVSENTIGLPFKDTKLGISKWVH
jgi:cytoskeletal protein CcmA (bactofilin family)